MRLVHIGTAAISVKVGDFAWNTGRLRAAIEAAREANIHLLVTPELGISGYSLEDRICWPDIERQSWAALNELAPATQGIGVFVGLPVRIGPLVYNAAAFVADQKVRGLVLKKFLPTYSIFYEGRNWSAWKGGCTEINGVPAGDLVFDLPYGKVTAEICEDLWSARSPAWERVLAGAEIVCNPSASPFTPLKNDERRRLIRSAAGQLKSVYAYVNLLGCDNSRLIFDGSGFVATPEALLCETPILSKKSWKLSSAIVDLDNLTRVRSENSTWREGVDTKDANSDIAIIDVLDQPFSPASLGDYSAQLPNSFYAPPAPEPQKNSEPYLDELYDALILGLRDYYEKVGVFNTFIVALSGGRDSALCLLLAVEAAKSFKEGRNPDDYVKHVKTVYLPNAAFSSAETEAAARALAEELGVPFGVVPIDDEAKLALEKVIELTGDEKKVTALTKQNLQARIRGTMMLNWANCEAGLVLVTANLSEAAVGYTTTGGDNQGGFSPIANVPKTLVSRLLDYIAQRDNITAIEQILAIPPSAELAEDQRDETDLMPYIVLDDLLYLFARKRLNLTNCWKLLTHRHPTEDPEQLRAWTEDFAKRFVANQWKRDQHPVALKVMELDLDPKTGFRFPVTQSIDDELAELRAAKLS
jgi:NAD+ synthase (glutamine-hydrolysing)